MAKLIFQTFLFALLASLFAAFSVWKSLGGAVSECRNVQTANNPARLTID